MANKSLSPISKAREVLKETQIVSLPIDVNRLCKFYNIRVLYVDFSSMENKTKKEISGAIQRHDGKFTILVNDNDSEVRARFTIAHELGHYHLHMKDVPGKIITSFRRDQSPRETEANQFAAELLMPRKLIEREYYKMVIPVSDTLAKKFNVSKPAMRIRLDNLGLMYV
jgi:Zn-dependent peptidase ImmA (M78 family)